MQENPRDPKASIIDKSMIINIAVQSSVMTIAVLAAFYIGWSTEGIASGRTFALLTICLSELIRAYTCRSEKSTVFELGVFTNKSMNLATVGCLALLLIVAFVPGLRDAFSLTTHNLSDWIWIIGLGVTPFIFGELTKVVKRTPKKRLS